MTERNVFLSGLWLFVKIPANIPLGGHWLGYLLRFSSRPGLKFSLRCEHELLLLWHMFLSDVHYCVGLLGAGTLIVMSWYLCVWVSGFSELSGFLFYSLHSLFFTPLLWVVLSSI